ncbi:hypothetical protein AG1IA_02970 [Rhizoctonia solani AG-1 IA]|uniref:Polysaccharide lyase 14 domain-containing protein n=1 Tax=Thanatephorus cucumeris (strain AG1-IA) TaxID=983506 RepID=L8X1M8_THACA|nr:hypothetical protein AG1IA_02970 [Rhizoctonia solani AG-1 IA]
MAGQRHSLQLRNWHLTTMLDKIKSKLHLDSPDSPSRYSSQTTNEYSPIQQSHLFPIPVITGFTTLPGCTAPSVCPTPLDDNPLGIQKSTPGFSRRTLQIDGLDTYEASYPKGSINPKGDIKGGFGCYLERGEFEQARDVIFSYSNVSWQMEAQRPNWRMDALEEDRTGVTSVLAYVSCGGEGEIYAYIPSTPSNHDALQNVPPKTHCNPDFGWSIARGSFAFAAGEWTTIAERVRLNDIGCANGETKSVAIPDTAQLIPRPGIIQLWANGKLAVDIQGLEIRVDKNVVFRGAHFQTFFGGEFQSISDHN